MVGKKPHYSQKLRGGIEAWQRVARAYRGGLMEIKSYLQSDKFRAPDNMVNVNDVLLRIREIEKDIVAAEDLTEETVSEQYVNPMWIKEGRLSDKQLSDVLNDIDETLVSWGRASRNDAGVMMRLEFMGITPIFALYTVKAGETTYTLKNKYKSSSEAITEFNKQTALLRGVAEETITEETKAFDVYHGNQYHSTVHHPSHMTAADVHKHLTSNGHPANTKVYAARKGGSGPSNESRLN